MNRQQIFAIIERHARQVLVDLGSDVPIDTTKSLKEYGANSLDAVEIISATMRELRLKLPRAELSKLENIDGLIDLIEKTAGQKQ